jgi:hypothetical protein
MGAGAQGLALQALDLKTINGPTLKHFDVKKI